MAYTTEANVEALMGRTFDASSRPSSTEIGTIIGWSDITVDLDAPGATTARKELLSTLMTAHLVE